MHARTTACYRLFFALKPPPIVARQIDHYAETLAPGESRILPAHQHMTLGITTDWPEYPYELIKALIRSATKVMAEPFDLMLDQLSYGGRSAALRPSRGNMPLKELQAQLATAMTRAGATTRPGWSFNPHQTLFYRNGPPGPQPIAGFGWRVEDFVLVCSHFGRTRHATLGCWPLKGGAQYRLF